ncbi:MAG TPA: trehalose-phosphatase [Acidimicrobiia bacterium]|nr:trehalose-phosphatase [Acidimicrobiia bacterium]
MTLEVALQEIMASRRVLLGLDFDGTLAPLVDDPDLARADPGAETLLETLADAGSVDVLILSGRAHADLSARVGTLPGVTLVGEHGNDSGQSHEPVDFDDLDHLLAATEADTPGSRVEHKPNSRAFHTRNSPADAAAMAQDALRAWASGREGVRVLAGKDILELTIAESSKGDVIAGAFDEYDGVIYIGDDTTDETVFDVLRPHDIGIKVGEGETAARFRVPDVDAVVQVLETITRLAL